MIVRPTEFPLTVAPRKARRIVFAVAFDCANDPLATTKTATHWDHRVVANVRADGDGDARDDVCPHDAPSSRVDPMNPKVKDEGCAGMRPDRTRGADVFARRRPEGLTTTERFNTPVP